MKRKKLIIGLTGGIGSGKSTVCQLFRDLGIIVIDADQIAREIVAPDSLCLDKMVTKFGPAILNKNKTLNREALRDLIFNNLIAKKWLENLLHPLIYKTMIKRAQKASSPYVILAIPLLAETLKNKSSKIRNPHAYLDRILVVDTTKTLQIARIKKRDSLSIREIKKIIKQQVARKERLAIADDVIENKEKIKDLKDKIDHLHKKYVAI